MYTGWTSCTATSSRPTSWSTDGGLVKVLDFGIAILRGAGALPRLTQVDRTVGTPAYMSPEQCAGQLVTPASDVYSLGCLLFELLTGDVPFHGSSRVPLRVAHQESAAPSVAAARPSVPPTVDALVAAMLGKDPAARPAAEAVYRALLPIAAGTVAAAAGPLPGDEERRNPVRPFRQPLLGPTGRDPFQVPADGKAADDNGSGTGTTRSLTEEDAARLRADVQALLDGEHPSDAISLLEAGLDRAVPGSVLELQLRRTLAAALLIGGQVQSRRAAFRAGRDGLPAAPGRRRSVGTRLRLPGRARLRTGRQAGQGTPPASLLRAERRPAGSPGRG